VSPNIGSRIHLSQYEHAPINYALNGDFLSLIPIVLISTPRFVELPNGTFDSAIKGRPAVRYVARTTSQRA
jgi:hypothetical protein